MVKVFSLFDYYKLIQRKNILISYKGPITPVIMAEISTDIRAKLADDPKASRKMFAIFMELAQNTLYYSAEKVNFANRNDSVGILLLTESEDGYAFYCGNVVENARVSDLAESCNMINSLDREELRRFKREQRNGPQKEFSKGAGIGLIHVALTSESPLQIESQPVDDDYSFFAISVNIKKQQD